MSEREHPILHDNRAYVQNVTYITDERGMRQNRRTAFLTEAEEEWYEKNLEKYRKELEKMFQKPKSPKASKKSQTTIKKSKKSL